MAEPKKWMKAIWEISRDYRNSRWVGVCPALQLTVEAETLPELRKSIRKAEGPLNSFIWAMDDSNIAALLSRQAGNTDSENIV